MIWLTWRQFRVQAIAGSGALAALAIVLAVTGPGLADDYESGLASCGGTEACRTFARRFFEDHQAVYLGALSVVLLVPALVGLFWGAPLVAREVESGTHRLVWNQSVSRTRWLAVKLSVIGLVAMAVSGTVGFAVSWWAEPLDKAAGPVVPKMTPLLFDVRGIVPIGYAFFAFVLGVAVGILVRRALAAMAITVAVFTALQIAMPLLVRPHLLPPTRADVEITSANLAQLMAEGPGSPLKVRVESPDPGAWILTNETLDRSGTVVASISLFADQGPCAPDGKTPGPPEACFAEMKRLGYKQRLVYHGSDRFWPFQWIETGLYLLLGLGLAGFCFHRIRRDLN